MKTNQPTAILLADLGYGDAGKGSIVDALARELPVHTVVRYNGGAQAGHNVVTPDGRQHTFAQFGSGTFLPGVRTHLSRFMILHPLAMLTEERHLREQGVADAFERTTIERGALVISPFQQAANRLKEIARGDGRHGSCGLGIGETMSDWLTYGAEMLTGGDLARPEAVVAKLERIRQIKLMHIQPLMPAIKDNPLAESELRIFNDRNLMEITAEVFADFAGRVSLVGSEELGRLLGQPGAVVFEGAQGVLLDEWWGFYPYNSWSTLTYRNADTLLAENCFRGDALKLGLTRGYMTRHGAGPFVTEDAALTEALPDKHNIANPWQHGFRVGQLDLPALRYALSVTGRLDGLVVTNLDRMEEIPEWKVCTAYYSDGDPAELDADYEHQGGIVSAIRQPAEPTDLAAQEHLTRQLMKMRPVLETWPHSRDAYLERMERELGLPVVMTSAGPTALQRKSGALKLSVVRNSLFFQPQCHDQTDDHQGFLALGEIAALFQAVIVVDGGNRFTQFQHLFPIQHHKVTVRRDHLQHGIL
ncbi:MAG: adenylosuccinate synthetase [Anaerolineaceae bacterium]